MVRKRVILLSVAGCLALGAAAGIAVAQGPGHGPSGFGPHGPGMGPPPLLMSPKVIVERVFDRLDRNYDGVIDLTEFKAVAENMFDKVDTAKRGSISAADLKAKLQEMGPPPMAGGEGMMDRMAAAVLADFGKAPDGRITKAEFLDAYTAVFKYVNRAGDGRLTPKEVEEYINVARKVAPLMRP